MRRVRHSRIVIVHPVSLKIVQWPTYNLIASRRSEKREKPHRVFSVWRRETTVATETNAKATLRQRAIHEFTELAIPFVYLYITLGAVIAMKAAVLHTQGIEFTPWGIAVVKAAVLAKFMMLGSAMKIGERKTTSPLIRP